MVSWRVSNLSGQLASPNAKATCPSSLGAKGECDPPGQLARPGQDTQDRRTKSMEAATKPGAVHTDSLRREAGFAA